ncbi:MAG: hypothetical protein EOR51_10870 [Mesorhizobium sp.]|uniref:hypothetical protein n=1 Tax=Mesorhizobium sp. TaxID=1871066 RepID=UPI000FE6F502|nr:hypothetical protein [Mesorhizobium sp.]RWH90679.1 MAG: hypothetical protein EOQ88_33185 [Mesorhizobium sp.]RWK82641.1 MAG: hypothetical protein EOR51_10870 [Mesorhizobium sp.]RWL00415.1 MAG: hypothetical protein EOR55_28880 [Mesorhizobium sp.]
MTNETDLFGNSPAQGSLFGSGDDRMQAPRHRTTPDPDTIRVRLKALIEKARSADRMPWSEQDVCMWQTVFPNMAKWLPDDEANQLRFEFAQEIERLNKSPPRMITSRRFI